MLIISAVIVSITFLVALVLFVKKSYIKNLAETGLILLSSFALCLTVFAILLYYAKYGSSNYLLNKFLFLNVNLLRSVKRIRLHLIGIVDLLSFSKILFFAGFWGFSLRLNKQKLISVTGIFCLLAILLQVMNLSKIYILFLRMAQRANMSIVSTVRTFDTICNLALILAALSIQIGYLNLQKNVDFPKVRRAVILIFVSSILVTFEYIQIVDLTPSSLGDTYSDPAIVTFLSRLLYGGIHGRIGIILLLMVTIVVGSYVMFIVSAIRILQWQNSQKITSLTIRKDVQLSGSESLISFLHSVKNQTISLTQFEELCTEENFEEMMPIIKSITQEISVTIDKLYENSKAVKLRISRSDLTECVRNAVQTVNQKKSIPIQFKQTAEVYVMIDAEHITHAFENLLYNASDACEKKEDGKIVVSFKADNHYVTVKIKDNGVGIKEENMKKITQPFFSTKNSSHSWGMGLHHAILIVNAHHGTININSEEGKGTEVSIKLPTGK
ncbi:MAG: GHKL domain-containing protein [Lachnospiraceae bacterium]|nr:GHKL domain-containing protein [Lachnospiraceae bacterium]